VLLYADWSSREAARILVAEARRTAGAAYRAAAGHAPHRAWEWLGPMAVFVERAALTDAEVIDLVAYLRTVEPVKAP
jgi:hypothetical protein